MARQIKVPDLTGFAKASDIAALPQYVNNGDWLTRAQLKALFPAAAAQLGKLARVSDVWGSVRTSMICEADGATYYWRPQRTDYAVPMTQTSGALALIPLVTAPSLVFKSTLLGNMTLTPTTNDDVWPGCFFDVQAPGGLGLFTFTIGGLVGGLTTTLLGGIENV